MTQNNKRYSSLNDKWEMLEMACLGYDEFSTGWQTSRNELAISVVCLDCKVHVELSLYSSPSQYI